MHPPHAYTVPVCPMMTCTSRLDRRSEIYTISVLDDTFEILIFLHFELRATTASCGVGKPSSDFCLLL